MTDMRITGVTLAAVATDPALDEESKTLLTAAYFAVVGAAPDAAEVHDLATWARSSGYYAEAVATVA